MSTLRECYTILVKECYLKKYNKILFDKKIEAFGLPFIIYPDTNIDSVELLKISENAAEEIHTCKFYMNIETGTVFTEQELITEFNKAKKEYDPAIYYSSFDLDYGDPDDIEDELTWELWGGDDFIEVDLDENGGWKEVEY